MRVQRWLVLALLFASLGARARVAHASACCLSATAAGTTRLLPWERFAIGLTTTATGSLGLWGSDGSWSYYKSDFAEIDWRSDLYGVVALHDEGFLKRITLQGHLPWVMVYRRAGDLGSGVGGGLGDVTAAIRYDAINVGELKHVPGVALSVGYVAPTGTGPDEALADGDYLYRNVTGRGARVFGASLALETAYYPWFVRLETNVNVPLPRTRSDTGEEERLGVSVQNILSGGYGITSSVVLSAFARFRWEESRTLAGAKLPGSYRLEPGLGLGVSWRLHPHFALQASVDTGLFVGTIGRNAPGQLSGTLGVRYGYF